jgi:hypothetical protein
MILQKPRKVRYEKDEQILSIRRKKKDISNKGSKSKLSSNSHASSLPDPVLTLFLPLKNIRTK